MAARQRIKPGPGVTTGTRADEKRNAIVPRSVRILR